MAGKKRSSGGRKPQRRGLSGNPQRRAGQLGQRGQRTQRAQRARREGQRQPGGTRARPDPPKPEPVPWWPQSHSRVLAAVRATDWPARLIDVETRTAQVTGDEFHERIRSEGKGLKPAHWLAELAARTGEELRTAIKNGSADWERLWAFLCGLALSAPRSSPLPETHDTRIARLMTPLDDDPFEIAQAEAAKAAIVRANRGLTDGAVTAANPARPAGAALFARDAYGSRFLLAAPFGYEAAPLGHEAAPIGHQADEEAGEADRPHHWYAWDIDLCGLDVVVGAGTYDSGAASLAEWRDAVGDAAARAELEPVAEPAIPVLLDSCLDTGPYADPVHGDEPLGVVREWHRMRQRARALAWPADFTVDGSYDYAPDYHAFQAWYAGRHDDIPSDLGATVATIIDNWGPRAHPDAGSFYACSPHRIGVTAILLRDQFAPVLANEMLAVLPEWVQWCLSRSDPGEPFGAAARATAHAEAANLASDDTPRGEPDEGPFRRRE